MRTARAAASTTYFYVDTLEFLRRGGRIGPAAAMLGSALSVKPLLTVADGQIRPCERVRTESRALARLEELSLSALAAAAGRVSTWTSPCTTWTTPEGAARLVDRLQSRVRGSEVVVRGGQRGDRGARRPRHARGGGLAAGRYGLGLSTG